VIVSWAKPKRDEILLDVATGTGFTAFAFAPYVAKILALDITAEMIGQAKAIAFDRRMTNISFQVGESERLPFKDGIFNIVTCRIAAHHFVDVRGFLSEVQRVLAPGGRFLLADSCSPEDSEINRWHNHIEKLRDPSHVTNHLPSAWKGMIGESGIFIEKIDNRLCRTYLSFADWTRTAGCSEKVKEELLMLFRSAPRHIADAFHIYEKDGDIYFSWPLVLVKARKLQ
jgi:SAM-dependent methyltransferase